VRIVTLLPAATEIVVALGAADDLVGISHECDYPPSIMGLPRVTTTNIDSTAPSGLIDREVRRLYEAGQPVIAIDAAQLSRLRPDVIITQGLCEVCAVADGSVFRLAEALQPSPRVVSLSARDLAGIWADIATVGDAVDLADDAEELVLGLQARLQRLRALGPSHRARVLCVEWLDPLYLAGHWVPELVDAAGGVDAGARPGSHSARAEWHAVGELAPDHVLIMLCGFGVERARSELEGLSDPDAIELMTRTPTWIIDGNAYTSRPGPRVVDAAEQIHSILLGKPSAKVGSVAIGSLSP
jgi:iron complex transport system substrate-binding protein